MWCQKNETKPWCATEHSDPYGSVCFSLISTRCHLKARRDSVCGTGITAKRAEIQWLSLYPSILEQNYWGALGFNTHPNQGLFHTESWAINYAYERKYISLSHSSFPNVEKNTNLCIYISLFHTFWDAFENKIVFCTFQRLTFGWIWTC